MHLYRNAITVSIFCLHGKNIKFLSTTHISSMDKLPIHRDIWRKLEMYHQNKKIPHILFYGENGCGKKTLVMDFIYMIYNYDKQKIKQNTLFSNCSYSKGIKHIRENLKDYSRSNVKKEDGVYFKTIILYNFENLSVDGQSALRRVIETYSQTTRFFLILQSKNKILQPILSRFSHIYVPLPLINGVPTNLYTYQMEKLMPKQWKEEDIVDTISGYVSSCGEIGSGGHDKFVDIANKMCEHGYSCLDLMTFVKESEDDLFDLKMKANILMCFQHVHSEYRNEKLLILYMLDYMFARKVKDIRLLSFM
jgi:hypothetical protein